MQGHAAFLESERRRILRLYEEGRAMRYIIVFLKISIAILVIFYLFKSGWLTKETFTKLFRMDNTPP